MKGIKNRLTKAVSRLKQLNKPPEDIGYISYTLDKDYSIPVLESILSVLKQERLELTQKEIPSLLDEMGVDKLTLQDGSTISIDTIITASVFDTQKMHTWLSRTGGGHFVKVGLEFEKGGITEEEINRLKENGLSFGVDEKVHPMSLKAHIRRVWEESGELPPSDAITVSLIPTAKVK